MISKFIARYLMTLVVVAVSAISADARDFVLVIDPGHGGKDVGARGQKAYEKNINLAVAKLFGDRVKKECKDVKVVYTRDTDTFVSLKDRADIANKAGGDLFVSIHVNSVAAKARNRRTINGAEVYTLGLHRSEDNLAVAMRENSVMSLESDHAETYQGFDPESSESYIIFELSQSLHMDQSIDMAELVQQSLVSNAGRADKGVRQAGFWVLWATSMPSILIELDFICNPTQERYLSSASGQKELADAIFEGFLTYKEYNFVPDESNK
ncbi:MAG: N-acetylmuramoyl-L-alanine amidase [Muribaculaceae bacterium]|nr:N-acetylmuramoyl-L-alanine amidase [Muribaculaceae bacterium]MDE7386273.1 N-acetylmuramoyl-L-alanine amidase [Muribaculaceae bacterium]